MHPEVSCLCRIGQKSSRKPIAWFNYLTQMFDLSPRRLWLFYVVISDDSKHQTKLGDTLFLQLQFHPLRFPKG